MRNVKAIGFDANKTFVEASNYFLKKNKIYFCDMEKVYSEILNTKCNTIALISTLEHLQKPNLALENFKNSKAEYLYFNVPLFSFSVIVENMFQEVFPRHLSGTHTHLYTKESINYFIKKFKFKIVSEWWFGTDVADLYRSIYVKNKKKSFTPYIKKYLGNIIDDLQTSFDKNKICSEVHMVIKK